MKNENLKAEIEAEKKQSQEWWASLSKQQRFERMLQREEEFQFLQDLRDEQDL